MPRKKRGEKFLRAPVRHKSLQSGKAGLRPAKPFRPERGNLHSPREKLTNCARVNRPPRRAVPFDRIRRVASSQWTSPLPIFCAQVQYSRHASYALLFPHVSQRVCDCRGPLSSGSQEIFECCRSKCFLWQENVAQSDVRARTRRRKEKKFHYFLALSAEKDNTLL